MREMDKKDLPQKMVSGIQFFRCPSCGSWRPEFCITETPDGLVCDAEISAAVRNRDMEVRGE